MCMLAEKDVYGRPLCSKTNLISGPGDTEGEDLSLPVQLMPLPFVIFILTSTAFPSACSCSCSIPYRQRAQQCVSRCCIQFPLLPDQFLVIIHGIAMQTVRPTKRQEIVQIGAADWTWRMFSLAKEALLPPVKLLSVLPEAVKAWSGFSLEAYS